MIVKDTNIILTGNCTSSVHSCHSWLTLRVRVIFLSARKRHLLVVNHYEELTNVEDQAREKTVDVIIDTENRMCIDKKHKGCRDSQQKLRRQRSLSRPRHRSLAVVVPGLITSYVIDHTFYTWKPSSVEE